MIADQNHVLKILEERETPLLGDWMAELKASPLYREYLVQEPDFPRQCEEFLTLLRRALRSGGGNELSAPVWQEMREQLARTAESLVQLGCTPGEAVGFVLLLKRPLFKMLAEDLEHTNETLVSAIWNAGHLLDRLGLWKAEVLHKRQQQIIERQQQDVMELSVPVVTLWDGIVALPLIGTLDTARAQVVMESLLQRIVETRADIAILDITGVLTVDTMVAQHLLKAVTAARLMGAECIISGIRPTIAQTMVQLGVDLREVMTKATLADALGAALERRGLRVRNAAHNA